MTPCTGNLKFGEMEFGEMKRNTSNWSNFCMLPRRAGLSALAGLSCTYKMGVIVYRHTEAHWCLVVSYTPSTIAATLSHVMVSSWSGTSAPGRPFHHELRRRFLASSSFCKPSPAHCISLSSQVLNTYGCWAFSIAHPIDGLELAA